MFHHFRDEIDPMGQGALLGSEFERLLDWIGERYNLLNAEEYQYKAENGILSPSDVSLSLDDGLLCQFNIAFPILEKRELTAFFFIYSSPLKGQPSNLEIFRYFRTVCFSDISQFYDCFFKKCESIYPQQYSTATKNFKAISYLNDFLFYSENDKFFRYLRDVVLGDEIYEELMFLMFKEKSFSVAEVLHKLWMSNSHIKDLHSNGHVIGLHSFTHPTTFDEFTYSSQKQEYKNNYEQLADLLGSKITAMAHPCGKYDEDTLKILGDLGISIGFRSNMSNATTGSLLELPREDQSNIIKMIEN